MTEITQEQVERYRKESMDYQAGLDRIASSYGGEFSIHTGKWVVFTVADLQLLAHMALAGQPLVDAADIQRARIAADTKWLKDHGAKAEEQPRLNESEVQEC